MVVSLKEAAMHQITTPENRPPQFGVKADAIRQEASGFYSHEGKGGKTEMRELPRPAIDCRLAREGA